MNLTKPHLWGLVPLFVALLEISRVWNILPTVMQDEYVYSMQSRFTPFELQLYPNYLFSAVYSSTNFCGDAFYSCAKGLNSFFYIGTLLGVYLISQRFFKPTLSAALTTATAVSPLGVYVSFFMPESMYYCFVILTVYSVLVASKNGNLKIWTISGAMLGLTALVKPHAILILPAIVVYVFLISFRNLNSNLVATAYRVACFTLIFFAVKLGVGFGFAGTAGLTIFGTTYNATLNNLNSLSKLPLSIPNAASFSEFKYANTDQNNIEILDVAIPHAAVHFGLLAALAAFPIFISLSIAWRAFRKNAPLGENSQFLLLIGLISITMAVAVSLFEGLVSTTGDDHSSRIITRYYEFLWPLLLIAAALFNRFIESKIFVRIIQSALAIFLTVYFWQVSSGIKQEFSDSVILSGYLASPVALGLACTSTIAIAIIWVLSAKNGARLITYVLTSVAIVAAGISAQNLLQTQIGTTKAFFDIAGETSKPFLQNIDGSKILIVGLKRTDVFVSKFWIDKPGIRDIYLDEGQTLSKESVGDAEYVLNLSNTFTEGEQSLIVEGQGFRLVKINSPE